MTPWAWPTSSARSGSCSHRPPSSTSRTSPASPSERRRRHELAHGDHPPDRVREELRAALGQQVHVPRARPRAQDADPPGGRGDLRRARARGADDEREVEAEAPRLHVRPQPLVEEGRRSASPRGPHRTLRRPGDRRVMAVKRHKPTSPGRRFATWSDRAEVTKKEPEKSLTEGLTKSGG